MSTDLDLAGGFSEGTLEDEARARQSEREEERDEFEEWLDLRAAEIYYIASHNVLERMTPQDAVRRMLCEVAAEGARLHALLQETSR